MGEGTRELPESSRTLLVDLGADYMCSLSEHLPVCTHTRIHVHTMCVCVCVLNFKNISMQVGVLIILTAVTETVEIFEGATSPGTAEKSLLYATS